MKKKPIFIGKCISKEKQRGMISGNSVIITAYAKFKVFTKVVKRRVTGTQLSNICVTGKSLSYIPGFVVGL